MKVKLLLTGIIHFTTSTPGIGGKIKQKPTDFIVREITPEGRVLETTFEKGLDDAGLKVPERTDEREFSQLVIEMEKFNLDVNDAVRRITRSMGFSKKRVGFAGMKDKRAVTVQRISLFNPEAKKVDGFKSRYLRLRNPEWGKERVDLGDLKGNRFEVTIRGIGLGEKELRKNLEECFRQMEKGVINYFGEQRFGGIRKVTHLVGKEFVKGEIEKGVMLYLTSVSPEEEENVKDARIELAKTGNYSRASNSFPAKYRYERAILHHLCRHPKDFVGAFQKLPRSLRYMFVHAYQSYLFNKIINKRIEEGIGLEKTGGDILECGVPTAALYGFESVLAKGKAGKIEGLVLEEEGISLENFRVRQMPEVSSKGSRKQIVLKPEEPKIIATGADELNKGKSLAAIAFSLPKGNYATIILRELMKNG